MEPDSLKQELTELLNRHSRENASNTPDFILAEFMLTCLAAFEHTTRERERWYGCAHTCGGALAACTGPGPRPIDG